MEELSSVRKQIDHECDMIEGNINRMCVTDDKDELMNMFETAILRLCDIYKLSRRRFILKSREEGSDE